MMRLTWRFEECLTSAGGPDAEGDRVVADRVDVLLLVDGFRRDARVAVLPDGVLEDLGRALVGVEGAGHGLDRARRNLVALLDQVDELGDDGLGGLYVAGGAVEGEHVATQIERRAEVALERPQHGVLGARQLRGDVVVDRQLPTRQAFPERPAKRACRRPGRRLSASAPS
jgi:hypothetical protein